MNYWFEIQSKMLVMPPNDEPTLLFDRFARDWGNSDIRIQDTNSYLHNPVSFSLRAIIHTIEKYQYVATIWSQNTDSYCFLCVLSENSVFAIV